MSDFFETPWTVARQNPLSLRFPRQEYWCGLPLPSPAYLPDPGSKPVSPALRVDSLPPSHLGSLFVFTGTFYTSKKELCFCTPKVKYWKEKSFIWKNMTESRGHYAR